MFEIRVGVIGYVSVGKTTVINALFGQEYGEVAMKRTTAVVNSFRIGSPSEDQTPEEDCAALTGAKKAPAAATIEETRADNAAFRNSNLVKEKTFEISLEEPLHAMRPDTKLVIVDIPGLNEAGTSSKYIDFVNEKWHTFDIMVVVMDARQGVNTEEQHDLLKLVKLNLSSSKKMPVIILGNKVDDPDNKEQQALLDEVRSDIAKLFGVSDRKTALQYVLNPPKGKSRKKIQVFPVVVPICAMHGFVYRCGSRLSFEEFCKMDADFIDQIGKDSYGRQWHRFGNKKKQEKAFEAVNQEDQRQDGVDASNFESFVKVLGYCIGDNGNQALLIGNQVDVAIKRMKKLSTNCDLASEVLNAYIRLKALGMSVGHLPEAFWASLHELKRTSLDVFKSDLSPVGLAPLIGQFFSYQEALQVLQWPGEMEKVVKCVRDLALEYVLLVTESENLKEKSGVDQYLILGSMLLCSSNDTFNMHFGFLRLYLESKRGCDVTLSPRLLQDGEKCPSYSCTGKLSYDQNRGAQACNICRIVWIESSTATCPTCPLQGYEYGHSRGSYGYSQELSRKRDGNGNDVATCTRTSKHSFRTPRERQLNDFKMKVDKGQLLPVKEASYKEYVKVVIPATLEDPSHFGHLLWKCCQLLRDAEVQASDSVDLSNVSPPTTVSIE